MNELTTIACGPRNNFNRIITWTFGEFHSFDLESIMPVKIFKPRRAQIPIPMIYHRHRRLMDYYSATPDGRGGIYERLCGIGTMFDCSGVKHNIVWTKIMRQTQVGNPFHAFMPKEVNG